MKTITLAAVITLCGCGTNAYQAQQQADPNYAQCDYETSIAIQNIDNPLYAGIRKGELMRSCLAAKSGK